MESPYQCDRLPHSWRKSMSISSISQLTICNRSLVILWQSFIVGHHLTYVQSWSAIFSRVLHYSIVPKAVSYLCWSHSALGCRCLEMTVLNKGGNQANYQYHFRFLGPGLSHSEMSIITGYWIITVAWWHIKSPTPCLRYQQPYPWVTWASVEDDLMSRNHKLAH